MERLRCFCEKLRLGREKDDKTVSAFLGFFLLMNFCLGTGFLGIPYAFYYGGYLAAVPTLIFITFITWVNANYLLEVMARAQALEYLDQDESLKKQSSEDVPLSHVDASTDSIDASAESEPESKEESSTSLLVHKPTPGKHPIFEISQNRKFEVAELCKIFYHKSVKYTYLVFLSLHNFLFRWSFAAVAASAWAVNIPFRNFGAVEMCEEDAFLNRILPSGGCLYSYYLMLTVFAIIVVTLSLFDIKQQVILQLLLGILRFVTIISMVIYSIVQLAQGGDACLERSNFPNATKPLNIPMSTEVFKFDPRGWLLAIPIFCYAFLFHTGLSSLSHPIKPKKYIGLVVQIVFAVAFLSYISLGIVLSLWFRASVQETSTLNWALFTRPGNSLPLRFLSYYIVIFPSVDVVAAYPLANLVLVNNLYIFITGHDTSIKSKNRACDCCLRLVLKIVSSLLPIIAAFGVANLIHVLKYAGLFGFMCFAFPTLLHLKSIYDCKKRFSYLGGDKKQLIIADEDGKAPSPSLLAELKELFLSGDSNRQAYMTPYSSILFSHPTFALSVGVVSVFVFFFAFLSLFLHPFIVTCSVLLKTLTQ